MIRLLIADDEALERETLADIVARRFEHEVTIETAENGRKAADTAVLWGADLILMDIEMPGMNGLDAARAVLEQQRTVTGAGESVFCLKSEAYYYKRWQVYCRVNDIPPVSAYEMRHTFVSVAKKLPAGEVKDLVGHSEDMDTFGVYGHALTGEDTETAQAVNGMFLKLLHAGK